MAEKVLLRYGKYSNGECWTNTASACSVIPVCAVKVAKFRKIRDNRRLSHYRDANAQSSYGSAEVGAEREHIVNNISGA